MTADDLHNAGSAIEAAATMADPERPVRLPMPVLDLAHMLMSAAARLRELERVQ